MEKYLAIGKELGLAGDKLLNFAQVNFDKDREMELAKEKEKTAQKQIEIQQKEIETKQKEIETKQKEIETKAEIEKEKQKTEIEKKQIDSNTKLEIEREKNRTQLQKQQMEAEESIRDRNQEALEEEKKREHEKEMERLKIEQAEAGLKTGQPASGSSDHRSKIPLPKLPMFDEKTDDINAFFARFENHAKLAQWGEDRWVLAVASVFKGSALTLYHSITSAGDISWNNLKEVFLKKYQCTEDSFRERLRNVRPEQGESFSSFLITLHTLFDRWID